MATKKQKREAGIKRHEAREAERRRTGLAAQRADQAERFRQKLNEWEDVHLNKHHKFVDECPHCQIIKAALSRGKTHKEAQDELKDVRLSSRPDTVGPIAGTLEDYFPTSVSLAPQFSSAPPDAAALEMECR